MERTSCPNCGSEHLTRGTLKGSGGGHTAEFQSNDARASLIVQLLKFTDDSVGLPHPALACVDCGLLWTMMDAPSITDLREKLRRFGDPNRLKALGMVGPGEVTPAAAPQGRGDEPTP